MLARRKGQRWEQFRGDTRGLGRVSAIVIAVDSGHARPGEVLAESIVQKRQADLTAQRIYQNLVGECGIGDSLRRFRTLQ